MAWSLRRSAVRVAPVSAAVSPKYWPASRSPRYCGTPSTWRITRTRPSSIRYIGPGRIALRHDHLSRRVHTRLELGEDDADHRLGGQACERREVAEEALQRVVFELELEVRADIGIGLDQLGERRSIEPQRQDIAARTDGGQTRAAVEQLGFAEAVAGVEHVERDFVVRDRCA